MMGKESLVHISNSCVFRETFSQESITKNGGTITGGVTLNDGVATFDGTTGYIRYPGILLGKNSFTMHIKFHQKDLSSTRSLLYSGVGFISSGWNVYYHSSKNLYLTMYDSTGGIKEPKISCTATGDKDLYVIVDRSNNVAYLTCNGVTGATVNISAFKDIPQLSFMNIGATSVPNFAHNSTIELLEIYDRALTASEVSLLSTNNLYSGYTR